MNLMSNKRIEIGMLICSCVFIGLIYSIFATKSGLWYDEAIEYFYSKYLYGTVPGGRDTYSMYERICSTYQPPLYNWFMYLWLKLFDGEFMFRFAGVLTTIVGAIGFYKSTKFLTNWLFANVSMIMYCFTSCISKYALECAEYNLMLCFVAWSIYFFLRSCFDDVLSDKSKFKYILGFFLTSIGAVYSQYGAVFIVLVLAVFMFGDLCFKRNRFLLIRFIGVSIITLIIAVFPLVKFFLLKQLSNQGTIDISHIPFENGLMTDLFMFAKATLSFVFMPIYLGIVNKLIVGGVVLFFVFALCFSLRTADKRKKNIFQKLICLNLFLLFFLFFMIDCRFYGYNPWEKRLAFGNRYSLFVVPLLMLLFSYGFYMFCEKYKMWKSSMICFVYVVISVMNLYSMHPKSDVRECVNVFLEQEEKECPIFLHEWCDANFYFYFSSSMNNQVVKQQPLVFGKWVRKTNREQFENYLCENNVFQYQKLYIVTPTNSFPGDNINLISTSFLKYGYSFKILYKGESSILFFSKGN